MNNLYFVKLLPPIPLFIVINSTSNFFNSSTSKNPTSTPILNFGLAFPSFISSVLYFNFYREKHPLIKFSKNIFSIYIFKI